MIGGQVADLEAPGASAATEELVAAIHENKTGRLMRASLALGGILSFATEEDLGRLDRYGRAVGLAFQIKDDLLDVESDAATLGKTPGKDAAADKATFPAVWGDRALARDARAVDRRGGRGGAEAAGRRRNTAGDCAICWREEELIH